MAHLSSDGVSGVPELSQLATSELPITQIQGLPKGVRGAMTLRGRGTSDTHGPGASRGPYAFFNLGIHVGDRPEAVMENRRALEKALGVQAQWLTQVHGTEVLPFISSAPPEQISDGVDQPAPQADASFTSHKGLGCAILVADCMPVLVARADGGLVGAAHAGWRGLAQGVLPRLLDAMYTQDPSAAEQGFALWLGPCIGSRVFEVGPEVRAAFAKAAYLKDSDLCDFFTPGRQDRLLADLAGLARLQTQRWAREMGLSAPSFLVDQRCTVSDKEDFFSYRREGTTGRMAALIWRDPD
jgi:polyphenol oxidase